jgi:hypothetical protein
MFYYSKSKYVLFNNCNRRLWLEKYKKEEMKEQGNQARLIAGNQVGDLAMNLFGDYYLAETNPIDINKMCENTINAINNNIKVICEAAFVYENNYCAVDILKVIDKNTVEIYEVKSVTEVKKYHIIDTSYQYYVLKGLGYNIKSVNLVIINKDYVSKEDFDLNEYFKIVDVTNEVIEESKKVKSNLDLSDKLLNDSNNLPDVKLSKSCTDYDGCPFQDYCYKLKNIPDNGSVLDLYNNRSKWKQIDSGIITFNDLLNNNCKLSDIQKRQIDFYLNDRKEFIDKIKIKEFLNEIKYPIYFFDFETYQAIIPDLIGIHPNQQIPFQYSLHIMYADGRLEHKEYLGDGINDPRPKLIKQMLSDLGSEGSIIAYNMSFEIGRIKELAYNFKKYYNDLYALIPRFIDLLIPFQNGYYYNKDIGGSFSIKSVLPALFPDEPSLNYHNLEDVHRGDEASDTYINFKYMEDSERIRKRNNLLKYCCLDTYAMVKLYEKLNSFIKDDDINE